MVPLPSTSRCGMGGRWTRWPRARRHDTPSVAWRPSSSAPSRPHRAGSAPGLAVVVPGHRDLPVKRDTGGTPARYPGKVLMRIYVGTSMIRIRTFPGYLAGVPRSEEHTSELQSRGHLVCRLLLEKKKSDQRVAGVGACDSIQ